MYWFYSTSILNWLLYLLFSFAWMCGGYFIVARAFRLRPAERLFSGLAAGFLLLIFLANLFAGLLGALGQSLPTFAALSLPLAFWLAALSLFIVGLALAWPLRRPTLPSLAVIYTADVWLQIGFFLALFALFLLIQRGLGIFDEYMHLPLVSVMATGDIPPHFYLNPDEHFAYHYGLQVFAASLINQAGFFPWSAFDIARALAIAFTFNLGWLWFRRLTRNGWAAVLGSFLLIFAGGARWLLLALPSSWVDWLSAGVTLSNTGANTAPNLAQALHAPWVSEGLGAAVFPFAFYNGLFVPALAMLGSTGAMPYMTVLLLLLLNPRRAFSTRLPGLVANLTWAFIFTTLALSAEHLFAFWWAGMALALVLNLNRQHLYRWKNLLTLRSPLPTPHSPLRTAANKFILLVLVLSAGLSVVQGAFITEVFRGLLERWIDGASGIANSYGFSFRWPPGFLTAHLGELSLFDLRQLIVALAELGPAVLLLGLMGVYTVRQVKFRNTILGGLGIAAGISLFFPIFIQYGVDRSITRMPATALWLWVVMAFPLLWRKARPLPSTGLSQFPRGGVSRSLLFRWGYLALICFTLILGGVVIFIGQLPAISAPQLTYFVDGLDARLSLIAWNRLPPKSQVFDRIPYRSVTLFGRAARANESIYISIPEIAALRQNPDPGAIARAGYDYLYLDDTWWERMTSSQQQALRQSCLRQVYQVRNDEGQFRSLWDIRSCK